MPKLVLVTPEGEILTERKVIPPSKELPGSEPVNMEQLQKEAAQQARKFSTNNRSDEQ